MSFDFLIIGTILIIALVGLISYDLYIPKRNEEFIRLTIIRLK